MSSCIVLLLCGLAVVATGKPTREKRLVLTDGRVKWPNGVIPYELPVVNITKRMELIFEESIEEINNVSCVRWVHKSDPAAIAQFPNGYALDMFTVRVYGFDQGWDSNGFILLGEATLGRSFNPEIRLNVGGSELHGFHAGRDTVLHEMMHVMGFLHEHDRSDAHEHVHVPHHIGYKDSTTYNLPFDYESIMLYRHYTAIDKRERINYVSFSKQDILILNIYYECYPKQQKICKSIDHTNLRHFVTDGEIGKFSQFNANFTEPTNWTDTDTIRIGERCESTKLDVGCLVETTDESGTVKSQFVTNGCWIERKGEAVKCDLQFEGEKLTSVNFPLSDEDQSDAKCFIQM